MSTRDELRNLLKSEHATPEEIQGIENQITAIVSDPKATPSDGIALTWDEVAGFLMHRIRNTVVCAFCRTPKQKDECAVLPLSNTIICRACNEGEPLDTQTDDTQLHELEQASYHALRRATMH